MPEGVRIVRLGGADIDAMRAMNALFGRVFEMPGEYEGKPPSGTYLGKLLADEGFVALAAYSAEAMIGALAAYRMQKFEQERAEYYIYDLAVEEAARRKGIATALIDQCLAIAKAAGAWSVMIQADEGDQAPIALYSRYAEREDVHHFDIRP